MKNVKDKKIKLFAVIETGAYQIGTKMCRQYLKDDYGRELVLWASYHALKASNRYRDNSDDVQSDCEFVINYRTGLSPALKIEWIDTGELFDITYIDNFDGYKADLKLSAVQNLQLTAIPREGVSP